MTYVGRQLLAALVGVAVSFALTVLFAGLLYQFSGGRSQVQLGEFARHVCSPVVALVSGLCVGLLAKSRPMFIAGISLLPWAARFSFFRRLDVGHTILILMLSGIYILIGMLASRAVFGRRARLSNAN